MRDPSAPRSASRNAGEDDHDPYEEVDVSQLPEWWRRNVEEHAEHGLRPYRPPRFQDGTPIPQCIEPLAAEIEVEIRFVMTDPEHSSDVDLLVEETTVYTVACSRKAEGYTVYECTAEEIEEVVRATVD